MRERSEQFVDWKGGDEEPETWSVVAVVLFAVALVVASAVGALAGGCS